MSQNNIGIKQSHNKNLFSDDSSKVRGQNQKGSTSFSRKDKREANARSKPILRSDEEAFIHTLRPIPTFRRTTMEPVTSKISILEKEIDQQTSATTSPTTSVTTIPRTLTTASQSPPIKKVEDITTLPTINISTTTKKPQSTTLNSSVTASATDINKTDSVILLPTKATAAEHINYLPKEINTTTMFNQTPNQVSRSSFVTQSHIPSTTARQIGTRCNQWSTDYSNSSMIAVIAISGVLGIIMMIVIIAFIYYKKHRKRSLKRKLKKSRESQLKIDVLN